MAPKTTPEKLNTRAMPNGTMSRIIQFPLVRILLAVAFLLPVALFHNTIVGLFLKWFEEPTVSYVIDLETILDFALFLMAFRIYTRLVEKRTAGEVGFDGALPELATGYGIGGGLVAVIVLIMVLTSGYRIADVGTPAVILHAFFTFGIGAFIQELIFRVIIFKNVEELVGSWLGLALIAIFFGLIHLGNQNATLWTSLAIALADILLTAAFILTRRIWLVWGIHFGWNFFQDGIFGMPNSGETAFPSWITPEISGPAWLTGGSFGIEASYLAIALSVIAGLYVMKIAVSHKQTVRPTWKR